MMFLKILLALLLLLLLICYICYRIAFYAPKRVADADVSIQLPDGEQYVVVRRGIQKSVDEMLARPFEPVWITSFDGTKLFARYYHTADGAPVQILFHGYKSSAILDCCGGSHFAIELGQNALVVDQRSHGKSEGKAITFGIKERKDCLCWIEYVLDRFGSDTKIVLAGLSMGAATVLMAADQKLPENVVGIIADCPYSAPSEIIKKVCRVEMHLPDKLMYPFIKLAAKLYANFDLEESSAISATQHTKLPILLIHGEADSFVPCDMSRAMKKSNPNQITLVTIPGAGHGLAYMTDPKCYEEAVKEFTKKILG